MRLERKLRGSRGRRSCEETKSTEYSEDVWSLPSGQGPFSIYLFAVLGILGSKLEIPIAGIPLGAGSLSPANAMTRYFYAQMTAVIITRTCPYHCASGKNSDSDSTAPRSLLSV